MFDAFVSVVHNLYYCSNYFQQLVQVEPSAKNVPNAVSDSRFMWLFNCEEKIHFTL